MSTIIIHQKILPHYRVAIFDALINKLKNTTIIYGQQQKNESLKSVILKKENYTQIKNYYFFKDKIFYSGASGLILKNNPKVIITQFNVGNLNLYLLFLLRPIFNYKIILWNFGYDPENGFFPKKILKDKVRLFFYQKSDASIFYWKKGKEVIEEYSVKTKHYFVAPNTLDTVTLVKYRKKFDSVGKGMLKAELGIIEKYHFVYVGRLLEDKQIDLLFKAYSKLKNQNKIRLSIIGAGPELLRLRKLAEELNLINCFFLGEILDQVEVGKWIYISDAFVMPGRLGNSVVHSFCFGVPIISQKKDYFYHGEGIGYIKNNENAFLAKDNDELDFAEKMKILMENPLIAEEMKEVAIKTVEDDCSLEKMIEGFENAINYVTKNNHENSASS